MSETNSSSLHVYYTPNYETKVSTTSQDFEEETPFIYSKYIKSLLKNILILIYFFLSSLATKIITMYLAIPNVKITQAPAHDILLSNLTKPIRIAFTLSEAITGTLAFILILLSVFNKTHRFSIISRLLFILASIMNLRAICIAVTTFSVPTIEYLQTCGQLQSLKTRRKVLESC